MKCTRKELALAKELAKVGWDSISKELGWPAFEWLKLHKLARRGWIEVAKRIHIKSKCA